MTGYDPKADLQRYLQNARDAVVWKLDGASEYDVRRPLTPTGTNLLGLVKHLASVELGYFCDTFDRPSGIELPWYAEGEDPNADLSATAEETRQQLLDMYRSAWSLADATIAALPLDALGRVPWWPADRAEVTLHRVLIHMIAETARHAGHADIVRELIDGSIGIRAENTNLPDVDEGYWPAYRERLEAVAQQFARD
ncbi:DinB family protein [Jatrophihabitans sp.]|uniref:DinB family protein n=1 Tax=Jatrophihabitans sp. TaxID=1932789 RepID=UPI0030C7818F